MNEPILQPLRAPGEFGRQAPDGSIMHRWSRASWAAFLLLVFGCSGQPLRHAQQPTTAAPSGPPAVQLWDDGIYLAGIKPFVLFAAWNDGTVVRRVDGRLKIGTVAPEEIKRLLRKLDKAGFFTPPLKYGFVVPDGPSRTLVAAHKGRKMTLCHSGKTDFSDVGPRAAPSRQQLEAFAAMWQRVRKAIDAVQPAEMRDVAAQLDLKRPEVDFSR